MRHGFTLLELSIVLVIIGLIIGGITAGQELIRSAELSSVISDKNKYKVALNTFSLKYNLLPGDMDNAQSYWPSCVDNGVNPCNGNKNGFIGGAYEQMRAWQHMSLANVIFGGYHGGQIDPYSNDDVMPPNKIGSHWIIALDTLSFNPPSNLTAAEVFMWDEKYDDGNPVTGEIFLSAGDDPACLASDYNAVTPSLSSYILSSGIDLADCNGIVFLWK